MEGQRTIKAELDGEDQDSWKSIAEVSDGISRDLAQVMREAARLLLSGIDRENAAERKRSKP